MRVLRSARSRAHEITEFDSRGAASVALASGSGDAHVYSVRFDPGGEIGRHVAGFGQLFVVVEGRGWAAGADGVRVELGPGDAAYFGRGELHAKGSDEGMTAVMMQVRDLETRPVAEEL